MLTLYYPAYEQLSITEQPIPVPGRGEVRLRVEACGICGSELDAYKSRSPRRVPPLILGHEFCGIVDEAGPEAGDFKPGDRVVAHSLISCASCPRCERGEIHLCARRDIYGMRIPGGFAEYVVTPVRTLISWPESVPAEAACMAEPLSNGVHIANLIQGFNPRKVAIIGAGPIGLFAQQAIQTMLGAETITSDLLPARLDTAKKLGASAVINSREIDFVSAVRDLTAGEGADVVVDAVGSNTSKRLSLQATRPGGASVWIGTHENTVTLDSYDITLAERHVLGSYAARMDELQMALDLIESGRVDASSWTTQFPLSDGVEAFETMLRPTDEIKAILRPGPSH